MSKTFDAEDALYISTRLKEEDEQLADFIRLYQSNATIHSALRCAFAEKPENLERLFSVINEKRLWIREKLIEVADLLEHQRKSGILDPRKRRE